MLDIVIPFYNRKKFIKRAIQSVQKQSFQEWTLWLIDDGSTDGSLQELKKEFESDKIKILSLEKNKGVSFARNYGIKQGNHPWVAFLDSDDEWLPQKLEKQMEYLKKYPNTALIHCDEIWLRNNQVLAQKKKHKKQGGRIFEACTLLCCISPSATIMSRSVLNAMPVMFREDFPVCEDYEMWLRVTSQYEVAFIEEALLIKHGGHEDQLSRAYFAMDYWRVKALSQHVDNKNLSEKERDQVKKILFKKCDILLKGYEKHDNFKDKKEIESYKNLC